MRTNYETFLKYCPACKKEKHYSKFGKHRITLDGHRVYCKECKNAKCRIYYRKNRENILARKKELKKIKREKEKLKKLMQKLREDPCPKCACIWIIWHYPYYYCEECGLKLGKFGGIRGRKVDSKSKSEKGSFHRMV